MSDESSKKFGAKIKSTRLAKGWDQHELARKIGSSATQIGRWENAKNIPQRSHYVVGLKRELGLTEDDFLEAFGARLSPPLQRNDEYSAFSFASAAERLGSFEALDKVLEEIEDEWPVPKEPGEYGENENWLELIQLSPESGGVVVHYDDEIVGYWECLAVCDDMYEAILRGENVNKIISPDDIEILMLPGTYKMYFVDLFLREFHISFRTKRLIIKDFVAFLREAAEEGIFFDRIVTNITGINVKKLCQGFGFRKVIDHQVHQYYGLQNVEVPAEIFQLIIGPDAKRLFSYDSKLADLYVAQGLFNPEA